MPIWKPCGNELCRCKVGEDRKKRVYIESIHWISIKVHVLFSMIYYISRMDCEWRYKRERNTHNSEGLSFPVLWQTQWKLRNMCLLCVCYMGFVQNKRAQAKRAPLNIFVEHCHLMYLYGCHRDNMTSIYFTWDACVCVCGVCTKDIHWVHCYHHLVRQFTCIRAPLNMWYEQHLSQLLALSLFSLYSFKFSVYAVRVARLCFA